MSAVPKPRRIAPLPAPAYRFDGSDGFVLHIPASAVTFNGFREWVKSGEFPEKLPVTYLSGDIFLDMSKEELETHHQVKLCVISALANLDREEEAGTIYSSGVLISAEVAQMVNNPDGVYVSQEGLRCRSRAPGTRRRAGGTLR